MAACPFIYVMPRTALTLPLQRLVVRQQSLAADEANMEKCPLESTGTQSTDVVYPQLQKGQLKQNLHSCVKSKIVTVFLISYNGDFV